MERLIHTLNNILWRKQVHQNNTRHCNGFAFNAEPMQNHQNETINA